MPSKSKSQQRFMGMVHAAQKGEKPVSKRVAKVAKSIDYDDADDFASTKHKGLPKKVKKETKVRQLIRKMVREIMAEDFAGAYPKEMRKKFDKNRQKQSEVLGYKLTGHPDIKTEIDDATIKENTMKISKKRLKEIIIEELQKEEKLTEAKKETILHVALRVLKNRTAEKYKSKKGLVMIDLQSANLLVQVFKKVGDKMKKILLELGYSNPKQLMAMLWTVAKAG